MFKTLWDKLTGGIHKAKPTGKSTEAYRNLEIEATIKCYVSDQVHPFRLQLTVIHKGSFFTKDIFIKEADERSRHELFYNFSSLGMTSDELEKFGASDTAEYGFATLEEAKKAKDTTMQYIRFLCKEHQETLQNKLKIS